MGWTSSVSGVYFDDYKHDVFQWKTDKFYFFPYFDSLSHHVDNLIYGLMFVFQFPDSVKNKLAVDVINHLITHCCWLNMHIVPPHDVVFEIRVSDGYGARWSEDGTKVHFNCWWGINIVLIMFISAMTGKHVNKIDLSKWIKN